MVRVLELFSGTQSVGKICKEKGWESISLDNCDYKKKFIPTHLKDILEWDYKIYPVGHFDYIWCSPPCQMYSVLQNCWLGNEKVINGVKTLWTKELWEENMTKSDDLVKKCFEIIDYFKPKYWFLENPYTGLLKKREIMKDKKSYIVDYCMYCDWGYRKRTIIWSNKNLTLKKCNNKCGNGIKTGNRYKHNACVAKDIGGGKTRHMRYRIPPKLICDILG